MALGIPRTWAAGEVLTAANMNTFISDILNGLRGTTEKIRFLDGASFQGAVSSTGDVTAGGRLVGSSLRLGNATMSPAELWVAKDKSAVPTRHLARVSTRTTLYRYPRYRALTTLTISAPNPNSIVLLSGVGVSARTPGNVLMRLTVDYGQSDAATYLVDTRWDHTVSFMFPYVPGDTRAHTYRLMATTVSHYASYASADSYLAAVVL